MVGARVGCCLAVVVAGCHARPPCSPNGPAPPGALAADAVLLDVSEGQDALYYLSHPRDNGGGWAFDLWWKPLPTGEARCVSAGVGVPGRVGSTLFLHGLDEEIWVPALAEPWPLGRGVENLSASCDGRTLIYWRSRSVEGIAMPGDLMLLSTDDCSAAGCQPRVLASDVKLSLPVVSWDGRHAAITVPGDGHTELRVLDLTAHKAAVVLDTPAPQYFDFPVVSPTGQRVAVVLRNSPLAVPATLLHLKVFDTASGAEVPWAEPTTSWLPELRFLDEQTLLATTEDQGAWKVYLVGTSAVALLSTTTQLPFVGPEAKGYLIEQMFAASFARSEVRILDSSNPGSATELTSVGAGGISLDGQLQRVAFFENQDPQTFQATLVVASFPDGQRLASFDGVPDGLEGASWLGSAAGFAQGGESLLFLDGVAPLGQGGRLHAFRDGVDQILAEGVSDFRTRSSPGTVYYTQSGVQPTFGPPRTGTILARPLAP